MKTTVITALSVALLVFGFGGSAAAQGIPFGQWVTEGGKSRVEVFDCAGQVCGKIVWLEEPNEEDGTPKIDDENPDQALRARPLMGLRMIEGFVAIGPTNWAQGTIYNPEDGKSYASTMKLVDDQTLTVRGYVLLPLFGKSQTWTRFSP